MAFAPWPNKTSFIRAERQSIGININVYVLVRISIAVIKYHDTKQLEKKRIYLFFPVVHNPIEINVITQGRNLEARTDSEAMEKCCFLIGSPYLTQHALLYYLGLHTNLVGAFSQLKLSLSK